MCGIAGVVGLPSYADDVLVRMAERMIHRGPDSQGAWSDAEAGLAIRRLAIIDLDERSDQPLHLGPWHLVFNGEIYNYRELRSELRSLGHVFETEGDGEVLLHAWAEWEDSALDRLNGMFAFAVWHGERRELTLARDPFGEKPLFWASASGAIAFASEIRPLLAARPDLGAPSADAVEGYLGLGLMPPVDRSFFQGINQLPAAHLLRFSDQRVEIRQYWRPGRIDVPRDYNAASEALRDLLADSIRLRLRSDVPVGTSLSGGVDSSAIVSLASRIAGDHRRHAFTARFHGFERDEWRYAEAVARSAGVVEHHAVEPTGSGFLAELDTVVRYQEEPFGSASIYAQWCVMQAAREVGVTVLLDGQGADELFGGYAGINGWALRSHGPSGVLRGLLSSHERRDLLLALGSGRVPRALARSYAHRRTSVYAAPTVRDAAARVVRPTVLIDGLETPLARELLRQSFHTSLPALLRYADRNSMAHSREIRLPFLDRRIADFAFSLPSGFLYRDGVTKAILRDAVRGVAPSLVLDRRDKIGFEPPQDAWLTRPDLMTRICDVLLAPESRSRGLYATTVIDADMQGGHWQDSQGIMRALNLELWLRAFERSGALA